MSFLFQACTLHNTDIVNCLKMVYKTESVVILSQFSVIKQSESHCEAV